MNVNIERINGVWELGYSLDKHTISSTPIGYNGYGHMQYDTKRSEAGEAIYQLKYHEIFSQVSLIAQQMNNSVGHLFSSCTLVIPMPASKQRTRQPVSEIARELAILMGIPYCENLLIKTTATPAMKDISTREEKVSILMGAFTVNDILPSGLHDVLIVDDIFDTGSSLEAATNVLKGYNKIRGVYVATVTRKR